MEKLKNANSFSHCKHDCGFCEKDKEKVKQKWIGVGKK